MGLKQAALLAAFAVAAAGQNLGSLKRVGVPQPPELSTYVKDTTQLVALGKALFWDMQLGSDGRTACATCHFHAGADHRDQNTLSNAVVNQRLKAADYPFHALANPNDNRSAVLRDTAAIAGSAGLFRRMFLGIIGDSGAEDGYDAADSAFGLNGVSARQVTARNTPSVINAVFNVRNFWDGRASNIFTGATPFGDSDTALNAVALRDGALVPEKVRLSNSSLASQAVGPPTNSLEMSYDGRNWQKIGSKMLALRPLALQTVSPDDSVLGRLANPDGRGLFPGIDYRLLVQAAFQPEYWSGGQAQTESNFALFFGLAVQAYEVTLISDDTRFDRFSDGDTSALTALEQQGLREFRGGGSDCTNCHVGAEFTAASFTAFAQRGPAQGQGRGVQTDTGYFRTGVRPIVEDVGLGGLDGFGLPLSTILRNGGGAPVNGAFKTSGLRNAELTGPYFHNGGVATLEDVVNFYSRGGDFPDGGVGQGIGRRNFNAGERQSLVAFMKSLTDDRVRFERAPFDHPELCVPNGHAQSGADLLVDGSDARYPLSAVDRWVGIPAVGRGGSNVPLQTFEELLAGIGADGTRAHTLTDACAIP